MKVVETWQTEQQDDSAVSHHMTAAEIAHVRVLTGRAAGGVHVITAKGRSIGRVGGDCELVIDDGRMSRRHARIERGAAGWLLQDLNARNRGFVDGRGYAQGERVPLVDGSVLRLGDTLLVFRASAPTNDGRHESPSFPGVSPGAVQVRRRIDQLASGLGHVLVIGETGTGKERVARAMGSQRAQQPFLALNSAELHGQLARTELFGHVRGAFTNANVNKLGLVEAADEGVLFLDEIGELSPDVQPELLRFLEDGSYRPVGGIELRHSTARIVAATNVDLDKAVANDKFRRDLLARLRASHAPLELPPLRERREDILGWSQLFFRELGRDSTLAPWTVGALECLLLYPWPDNLRELRGVVAEAAQLAPEFPCGTEHLTQRLRNHRGTLRSVAVPADEPAAPAPEPTKAEIEEALRQTHGRMRTAAQRLNVDRRKLYRLVERFGIARESYRADTNREDE